jgi:hypothetical protein
LAIFKDPADELRRYYHIMGGRKAATAVKVDVGIISPAAVE